MKRFIIIMTSYIVCAFAVCLGIASLSGHLPLLLDGMQPAYRFNRGVLLFLDVFPALAASGFLVACSISFGRNSGKCLARFSPVIFEHYRNILICSILLVLGVMMGKENLTPYCLMQQQHATEAPYLLAEYISLGKQNFSEGKNALAHEYARHALALSPNNKDAQDMLEKTEALLNAIKPVGKNEAKSKSRLLSEALPESVTDLIKESKESAAKGEWFDSHYYAQLALTAGTGHDINLDDARLAAAEAWNHLASPVSSTDSPEELFYRRKLEAYKLLMQGDVLEAYYRFESISEESEEAAEDPDVVRYLGVAKEKLNTQYFFIDETSGLQRFESATNIYFRIKLPDDSTDVLYIHGITPIMKSGNMVEYFRELSVYSYDNAGKLVRSFEVPYAKMLIEKVETFGSSTQKKFGIKKEYKTIPYIMLESVGRNKNNSDGIGDGIIRPSFTYTDDAQHEESGFMVLPMPASDFNLICEASAGADRMNLLSLIKFVPNAQSYGYSREVFSTAMVRRLTYPLLILMLLIFCAAIAWNYRIGEKQVFKFKWIFVLPLSTIVAYAVLKALSTIVNIVNFICVALCGQFALVVSLAFCIVFLVVVSLIFLGRTSD
jgi:hypothetical protein